MGQGKGCMVDLLVPQRITASVFCVGSSMGTGIVMQQHIIL